MKKKLYIIPQIEVAPAELTGGLMKTSVFPPIDPAPRRRIVPVF